MEAKRVGDELRASVDKLDDTNSVPMGEYRFVIPRTYFSDRYKNPIVYFNIYEKLSETSFNGFFYDIEITSELEEKYEKQFKIAQEEISKEIAESGSKENSDASGGMGSIDIERER